MPAAAPPPRVARRHLDLATLRTLVAIVETGGMTRAAQRLHLTQSAVSMQVRRIEESLGVAVLERGGRSVRPTAEGERLVAYARQMLTLNDEAWDRLTTPRFEGTLAIGVPHDLVHPHIPAVLRGFGREFPRVRITLTSINSIHLREGFARGAFDLVLTTERRPGRGGEVLVREPLVWTGALGGRAWLQRPLPIAFTRDCMFREAGVAALDRAAIPWSDAVDSTSEDSTIVAVVADMAVRADMASSTVTGLAPIEHGGRLPSLPSYCVVLYLTREAKRHLAEAFAERVREAFRQPTGSRKAGTEA